MSSKKLTLKSRDGEHFEVEEVVALQSQTIKSLIEDVDCANNVIPLPNLTSKTLAKVLLYCKKHVEVSNLDEYVSQQDLKAWDADFVKVDRPTMFDLLKGADYLKIGSLLDLMSWTIANMLKDKSPEEIRKALNIKNDFTPEEEEAIRQAWGFEDLEVVFEISE